MRSSGTSWRWDPTRHPYVSRPYISVIEPAEDRSAEPPRNARRVGFGFGVRDEPEPAEWEGNPS
jgi:hypothetical protein